jgi:phosphatidylserine/phosphatidylglycerophosphate/cardiolipin synthase-like enzyme
MASFAPPVDPTAVTAESDVTIRLPDPGRLPIDPLGMPLIRQGVARNAGSSLVLMHVIPDAGPFALASPVRGVVHNVDLATPLTGGVSQLLEISPIPFPIRDELRALSTGLPTFYVGFARGANVPADDELVDPSTPLDMAVSGDAYLGVLFQDGMPIAPWSWIEMIGSAITNATDAAAWNALSDLYAGHRSLRVIDHAGHPLAGESFHIRIRKTDGTFEAAVTRTTGFDGDLEAAVASNPIPRSGGPQASLFGAAGEQTELEWSGAASSTDTPLPVHVLYDTGDSAPPGQRILLPAGTERGHLQVLELANWFAERPADQLGGLARFRTNSRVEPLVDGVATFKLLVDDLLAADGAGNGAHLAGWAFKDFEMDPGRKDGGGTPIDTSLTGLADRIMNAGSGGVRVLPTKFINFKASPDTEGKAIAVLALFALSKGTILFDMLGAAKTDVAGFFVLFGGLTVGSILISELFSAESLVTDLTEQSTDIFPLLNAVDPTKEIALWSSSPVTMTDNPVGVPLPLGLDSFLDRYGVFHSKMQLVKRSPTAEGDTFIAYLGGIDINSNRIDDPGHQGASQFHDVHARVTGPGAADAFRSWDERWAVDRVGRPNAEDPVFAPPDPATMNASPAKHIVQIGRTLYRPNPAGGSSGFPTIAPTGERTINDTLTKAIRAARQYIYIEDQYFTPNDSTPPGSADTYFDALLDAAGQCQRLVIVLPAETDQIFGDQRRRLLFDRLKVAWGDRVLIGTPLRRPLLSNPGRITSEGRCVLMTEMDVTTGTIILAPQARVPTESGFWLWVDGELMLVPSPPTPTSVTEGGESISAAELTVVRGPLGTNPRWGATPRNHEKGAAVTMSQVKGIFVHSKAMIVDDVFVAIGSANINRRGLFHDGEMTVFAVPEPLKASSNNPALALRTALWAEHLGLPPALGPTLLRDPIAAFELFRRTISGGNRFAPFSALDISPYLSLSLGDTLATLALVNTPLVWGATLVPTIWNDIVDPTTFLESDLDPTPGPT